MAKARHWTSLNMGTDRLRVTPRVDYSSRQFGLLSRRRWGVVAAVGVSGRLPAIVRWSVLEEPGILAERMSLCVDPVGLAEDLPRSQRVVVYLGDHLLVPVVGLRISREPVQIVVAEDRKSDLFGK